MTKGIRITLWILSSLAVLWTVSAAVTAGTMMDSMDGSCPMCRMMSGGGMMGSGAARHGGMMADSGTSSTSASMGEGMRDGGMMAGMMEGMMWMMFTVWLTWLIMLALDALFIYLVVTAVRGRRATGVAAPT